MLYINRQTAWWDVQREIHSQSYYHQHKSSSVWKGTVTESFMHSLRIRFYFLYQFAAGTGISLSAQLMVVIMAVDILQLLHATELWRGCTLQLTVHSSVSYCDSSYDNRIIEHSYFCNLCTICKVIVSCEDNEQCLKLNIWCVVYLKAVTRGVFWVLKYPRNYLQFVLVSQLYFCGITRNSKKYQTEIHAGMHKN